MFELSYNIVKGTIEIQTPEFKEQVEEFVVSVLKRGSKKDRYFVCDMDMVEDNTYEVDIHTGSSILKVFDYLHEQMLPETIRSIPFIVDFYLLELDTYFKKLDKIHVTIDNNGGTLRVYSYFDPKPYHAKFIRKHNFDQTVVDHTTPIEFLQLLSEHLEDKPDNCIIIPLSSYAYHRELTDEVIVIEELVDLVHKPNDLILKVVSYQDFDVYTYFENEDITYCLEQLSKSYYEVMKCE